MNRTIKNIFYVFTSATLAKLIGAVTALILPKLLDPGNYGAWVMLLLVISYAPIVALGTVEALLRQYPYYIGRGESVKARECEESVLGSICLTALFLIICGIFSSLIIADTGLIAYRQEITLIFFTAAISSFSQFYYFRYAAHQIFKAFSILDTLRAIVNLLFVCVFAWLWGLKGAVIGYLLVEVIVCISSGILSIHQCGNVRIRFDREGIWEAIKIGFPITIIWWALTLQSSVDRVVSSSFLGKEMTGYYGLGISIVSMMVLIPRTVNRVLYPRINEEMGKNTGVPQLAKFVISPVRILSLFIPLFIGSLIIILPTVYKFVFPKYYQGMPSAQILLIGFFFASLIGNGTNYLIAKNKQRIIFIFVLICLIFNVASAIYLVSIGLSIVGVAVSTCLTSALLATLIWRLALQYLEYNTLEQWRGIAEIYSPIFLMAFLFFIYLTIFPEFIRSTGIMSLVYSLIFSITYLLVIIFLPPFNKKCREIYDLFKLHLSSVNP